jgi:hypothetical protein
MAKPTRVDRKKKKKVLTEEEKHLPESIGIFPVEAIIEGPVRIGKGRKKRRRPG